jgi:hypothetical protein
LEATGNAYKKWPRSGETFADSARDYFDSFAFLTATGGPTKLQKEARELAARHAEEVIAAWDQWQADIRAAEERAGLTDAKRRDEEISAEWHEVARLVVTTQAQTIAGLLAKLTGLIPYGYSEDKDIEGDYADADDILRSVVKDAVALQTPWRQSDA